MQGLKIMIILGFRVLGLGFLAYALTVIVRVIVSEVVIVRVQRECRDFGVGLVPYLDVHGRVQV